MNRLEQKIQEREDDVKGLEESLSGALTPISPPSDVMQRLRTRIGSLEPNRISKRISNWELSIITAGSVMSVAMVILTIARALYYLFGHRKSIA